MPIDLGDEATWEATLKVEPFTKRGRRGECYSHFDFAFGRTAFVVGEDGTQREIGVVTEVTSRRLD